MILRGFGPLKSEESFFVKTGLENLKLFLQQLNKTLKRVFLQTMTPNIHSVSSAEPPMILLCWREEEKKISPIEENIRPHHIWLRMSRLLYDSHMALRRVMNMSWENCSGV